MKKIISISILIIIIAVLLCSCSHITYTNCNKSMLQNKFAIIREDTKEIDDIYLVYDKYTKIVYLCIIGAYHAGITPYYVVVDGKPTVAIYGVNYEYQE